MTRRKIGRGARWLPRLPLSLPGCFTVFSPEFDNDKVVRQAVMPSTPWLVEFWTYTHAGIRPIILPGGAGLVGQNLVARLKAKGYAHIVVLDKHPASSRSNR
jgi:hypothetical protein